MAILFEHLTKDQVKEYAEKKAMVLLPVGILEEHGPHLPINTDNVIAFEISKKVADLLTDEFPVLVMPTVWAGYHGKELEQIPGSIRVSPRTLYHFVYDICESLVRNGFTKIVLVNGHGQNPAILELVIRQIANDFDVNLLLTYPMKLVDKKSGLAIKTSPEGGAGGHAGELETALVLALDGEHVDMSRAPHGDLCRHRTKFFAGDMFPEHEVLGFGYYSTWALQGSKSGVLGEPSYATAKEGEAFLEVIYANYCELLREYYGLEAQIVTDKG